MSTKSILLSAVACVGFFVAFRRIRRLPPLDLRGRVVLITGGSRGLGLATAREFASRGAKVAICARNEEELNRAIEDLHSRGATAFSFVCDVADRWQVQKMVTDVTASLGPIDILVNNAGVIKVGPFTNMGPADFEQAMNVMFWGMCNATMAVLPAMRVRGQGSIVNVTSIGGKVAVPHLSPYCCAKFAAVAFSEGLGVELASSGIRVTTIVPGLMRTGSHLNAEFKGRQNAEYGWFAAGAATPVIAISAERAARSIVSATVRGERARILSFPAKILARVSGTAPSLGRLLLDAANSFLPLSDDSPEHSISGRLLEAEFTSSLWKVLTRLGQKAAVSLNELTPDFPRKTV